jgi:hypothetical protein
VPSSIRYKFVNNVTGLPFTIENFPSIGDGDDRLQRVVRRTLDVGDIGTDPGQTGHELGCIVDIIPKSYNVLSIQGVTLRELESVELMSPYYAIDGKILHVDGENICNVAYGVDKNNAIRVIDIGYAGDSKLAADDSVIVTVTIGNRLNSLDVLNKSDL